MYVTIIYQILPNVLLLERADMRFTIPLSVNFEAPNLKNKLESK